MGHCRHQVYTNNTWPRWVTVFELRWQVIECRRVEPAANLTGAMAAAIARLAVEGWQIEAAPRFGFAFIWTNVGATAINSPPAPQGALECRRAHRRTTTGRLGRFNRRKSRRSRLRSEKMPAACEVRR
jgi:hypothetical protein